MSTTFTTSDELDSPSLMSPSHSSPSTCSDSISTPRSSYQSAEQPETTKGLIERDAAGTETLPHEGSSFNHGQGQVSVFASERVKLDRSVAASVASHGLGLEEELEREEMASQTGALDLGPICVREDGNGHTYTSGSVPFKGVTRRINQPDFYEPALRMSSASAASSTQGFSFAPSPPTSVPASPTAFDRQLSDIPPAASGFYKSSSSSNLHPRFRSPSSGSLLSLPNDLERPKKRGSFLGMSFLSKKEKLNSPLSSSSSVPLALTDLYEDDEAVLRADRTASLASGREGRFRSSLDLQKSDLLPRFPSSRQSMINNQKRGEFLMRYQVNGPFTLPWLRSKPGDWRPHFITTTAFHLPALSRSEADTIFCLHVYKTNQHLDLELDRLRLTTDSVICVTDELADKKLYVLKITGLISAGEVYGSALESPKPGSWYFSMSGVPELTDWMKYLKGLVLQLRGVNEGSGSETSSMLRPASQRSRTQSAVSSSQASRSGVLLSPHPFSASSNLPTAIFIADESHLPFNHFPATLARHQEPALQTQSSFRRRNDSHDGSKSNQSKRYSFLSTTDVEDDFYAESIPRKLSADIYGNLATNAYDGAAPRSTSNPSRLSRSPSLNQSPTTPPPSSPLPPRPATAEDLSTSELKRMYRNSLYSAHSTDTALSRSSNGSLLTRTSGSSATSSAATSPSLHDAQMRSFMAPPPKSPLPSIPSGSSSPARSISHNQSSTWVSGSIALPGKTASCNRAIGLDEENASEDDDVDIQYQFPQPPNKNSSLVRFV